ncbi:hypothetical protein ACS0TY_006121 [Phlomoides rotata]
MKNPSLKSLMDNKWNSWNIQGWGGFILKEKLKRMKFEIKIWKEPVYGKLDCNIEKKKEEIFHLDLIDDVFSLYEEEMSKRANLFDELSVEMKWKDTNLFLKSREKWVKEGDCNSNYFTHLLIEGTNKTKFKEYGREMYG